MILNLGCGALTDPAWVNVDWMPGPGVNVVWDLDKHPWPFKDGQADGVIALDIYEHIDDPIGFMQEIWRVTTEGAHIRFRTSWWKSENSYRDPTHKRFLTTGSFDYWVPGTAAHSRYGAQYSRGKHFSLDSVYVDGQELEWRLTRAGECDGAC